MMCQKKKNLVKSAVSKTNTVLKKTASNLKNKYEKQIYLLAIPWVSLNSSIIQTFRFESMVLCQDFLKCFKKALLYILCYKE